VAASSGDNLQRPATVSGGFERRRRRRLFGSGYLAAAVSVGRRAATAAISCGDWRRRLASTLAAASGDHEKTDER